MNRARNPRVQFVEVEGRRLAYLDIGGPGRPLLALHGLFGRGGMFSDLADRLAPGWRVIALDQRGHGHSDRAPEYTREGYVADVVTVLQRLSLAPAVVLGHSLGGLTAYQVAARHPELIAALVVEDIGAAPHATVDWLRQLPERFQSVAALRRALARCDVGDDTYFLESIVERDDGWGFLFSYEDMVASNAHLRGDHWRDWCDSTQPVLLVHGGKSDVLDAAEAAMMVARRPGTELASFPSAGHTVHADEPIGFARAVRQFLGRLTGLGAFEDGGPTVYQGTSHRDLQEERTEGDRRA